MRRTTSLLEFSPFLQPSSRPTWSDENHSETIPPAPKRRDVKQRHSTDLSSVNAAHFLDAGPFLNACGLCKRSIGPGIDTFMYRGDVAFCSKECRDKRITEDRRKKRKKPFMSSMQKDNLLPPIKTSVSSA
ncbi:hypothetical protein IEQ34_010703 [Dendrobium chrysotoxum]|uniref:FLZ-type domain-containing protein n=1 Tax=Dendrobium chrysotoxum TaxID=161865 RepID=A0AAV7GXT3_DENCH|nr:hypothetical protein IEQ34_010703 [Dendrobium chrysotoxum]